VCFIVFLWYFIGRKERESLRERRREGMRERRREREGGFRE
jgi:hypothetical protein